MNFGFLNTCGHKFSFVAILAILVFFIAINRSSAATVQITFSENYINKSFWDGDDFSKFVTDLGGDGIADLAAISVSREQLRIVDSRDSSRVVEIWNWWGSRNGYVGAWYGTDPNAWWQDREPVGRQSKVQIDTLVNGGIVHGWLQLGVGFNRWYSNIGFYRYVFDDAGGPAPSAFDISDPAYLEYVAPTHVPEPTTPFALLFMWGYCNGTRRNRLKR